MLDALKKQVGGDHYQSMEIQPAQYILANDLGHYEASAIEYISRWKTKGGAASLEKAQQCLQILIDHANCHTACTVAADRAAEQEAKLDASQ